MSKFFGKIDQLKQLVENTGYVGTWEHKEANNFYSFKANTGEILNWWPANGTIDFQGKNKERMKAQIQPLLDDSVAPAGSVERIAEKKIFIVHGHDKQARNELELILRRLGLTPFILQNANSESKTIIEALEQNIYREAAFGIVLLTPDDVGYSKDAGETKKESRARQNVILEMGMVMAALGREKMVLLKKGALEMPSDANGIIYIEFNDHVDEIVTKLVKNLNRAGFQIDSEKIIDASA